MQQLIKQIEKEFDLKQSTILALSTPLVKYVMLTAFWTVLWANSISDCVVYLTILIVIAVFGRTVNKISLFLSLIIVAIIVGEVILTLHAQKSITDDNIIFALQVIILFSSPVILFGNSTVMQHYYFWSNIFGGGVGAAIIGFGRTLYSLRRLVAETRDAYRNKGLSPIVNAVPFLISLEASVIRFTRTYADAVEIKNVTSIRGEGSLNEGITPVDVLMMVVALLMPLFLFSA